MDIEALLLQSLSYWAWNGRCFYYPDALIVIISIVSKLVPEEVVASSGKGPGVDPAHIAAISAASIYTGKTGSRICRNLC